MIFSNLNISCYSYRNARTYLFFKCLLQLHEYNIVLKKMKGKMTCLNKKINFLTSPLKDNFTQCHFLSKTKILAEYSLLKQFCLLYSYHVGWCMVPYDSGNLQITQVTRHATGVQWTGYLVVQTAAGRLAWKTTWHTLN